MLKVLVGVRRRSFTLHGTSVLPLIVVKLLFSFSSLLLFVDCGCVSTKVTSAVLFICPMVMTIVVKTFFGRGVSTVAIFSVLLTLTNVTLLCRKSKNGPLSAVKVVFILLSSLSCTVCVMNIGHSALGGLSAAGLAFCTVLFNLSICVIHLGFLASLRIVPAT